jgi:hypothetical protein
MGNPVNELQIAEKIFLEAEYSSILEEIGAGKSRGQVVRRMVQEGYGMENALALYDQLSEDKVKSEELVQSLRREIEKARRDQVLQELQSRPITPPMNSRDVARMKEAEKNRKEMEHLAVHLLPHLLMKIFGF